MMNPKRSTREGLSQLFTRAIAAGKAIIAPKKVGDRILFAQVKSLDEAASGHVQTTLSAKSAVFPRCEKLIRYQLDAGKVKVEDDAPSEGEVVVFGLRPCDAAAFDYLLKFFSQEHPDVHVQRRCAKTTLVTLSCKQADENCFCTSVGGGPGSTRGSDLLLTERGDGSFYVEVLTEKGEALVSLDAGLFEDAGAEDKTPYLANVPVRFDASKLKENVEKVFSNPIWVRQSLPCLGCGACAFVCPTCTCFDIQDEATIDSGVRLRCWDSCGFSLFTLHTSGHNPRSVQSQRWRQRLLHKFAYAEQTMKIAGCVGCGRCGRVCPAGMDLIEHVQGVMEAIA